MPTRLSWKRSRTSARAMSLLKGSGVFVDTSLSALADAEKVGEFILEFGEDYIIFGSDSPWSNAKKELEFIRGLSISDLTRRKILFENALRIIL